MLRLEKSKEKTNSVNGKSLDEGDYSQDNRILCEHCQRSKNNGKSCIGMCVADSEY